jgi:Zn finger protein HypA/HybF involved in hydrogenase expression
MLRHAYSLVSAAVLVVFGAGCAAHNGKDPATHGNHGMLCPTCETVWVSDTVGQGTKVQRLVSEKRMTCPDCDRMAQAYMEGDKKVLHNCPTCKVTPRPVKRGPAPTHPKGGHGSP